MVYEAKEHRLDASRRAADRDSRQTLWRAASRVVALNTDTPASIWSVYIIRCSDGSLYTGIATDVDRRFAKHESQGSKGAKYTRARRLLTLVYRCGVGSRSEASKEEHRIKAMTRKQKLALIGLTDF